MYWASQYDILSFLDSNNYPQSQESVECILAAGSVTEYGYATDLVSLQRLHDHRKDWLFGHICYDHKNVIEPKLRSLHEIRIGFPDLFFFVPEVVIRIEKGEDKIIIESVTDPDDIFKEIITKTQGYDTYKIPSLVFEKRISKDAYLETISHLREHIANGDCYEINYCCEGFCNKAEVDPLAVFEQLNALSPAPFAAYYRLGNKHMMCASPERYLRLSGETVLSQPIKGTAPRGSNPTDDLVNKQALKNSIKEQAENVMIVDLVRNDLARCCETGSVHVDELFGIYTFPQVHQMISTVSGTLQKGTSFTDAIRCTFPMGSMTGAPKFKVMELIDKYELSRRELFSGTVGYVTPEGDFDFNVIIRSLFYNAETKYLSYQTGGAITYDSDPEQEWEEMRLKAWALERIFSGA